MLSLCSPCLFSFSVFVSILSVSLSLSCSAFCLFFGLLWSDSEEALWRWIPTASRIFLNSPGLLTLSRFAYQTKKTTTTTEFEVWKYHNLTSISIWAYVHIYICVIIYNTYMYMATYGYNKYQVVETASEPVQMNAKISIAGQGGSLLDSCCRFYPPLFVLDPTWTDQARNRSLRYRFNQQVFFKWFRRIASLFQPLEVKKRAWTVTLS